MREHVYFPVRDALRVHVRFLAAVSVITLLAGLPLFQFKEMSGHDSLAYLPRFVEFYENLKAGILVPRWAPDLGAGYGEPTFNFNPPLLYYLGSFFHVLGFTFIASENLSAFALLVLAGAGMYVLAAALFGRHGGVVAAAAYVFAPYLQTRLYVSHALADYAAFAFLPFAFLGVYGAVAEGRAVYRFIGALAVAALMLSSISVAVITMPPLAACALVLAARERSIGRLIGGAWAIGLGLVISAFFWIPALWETDLVHISRREAGTLNYHLHFLYIQQLIYSPWGYGQSVRGTGDGLTFALGPLQLLMFSVSTATLKLTWHRSPAAGAAIGSFVVLTFVAVFFMTNASLFIWDHVNALHPLQFPWRFLSFAALSTSLLCGAPFLLLRDDDNGRKLANILMVALVATIVLFNFRHADPQKFLTLTDADYSPSNIATKGLPATAREFEPIDVAEFPAIPASAPMTVLDGRAIITPRRRDPDERTFDVRVEQAARLRMNTFFFPGWRLYVDGQERATAHKNQNGLMDFALTPGTHTVRFAFLNTPVRTWSTRLSLAALLALVLSPVAEYAWDRQRRPKAPREQARNTASVPLEKAQR